MPPAAAFTGWLSFNNYGLLNWAYDNGNQSAVFLRTENAWLEDVRIDGFRVTDKPTAALVLGHNTTVDGLQMVRSTFNGWDAPREVRPEWW